jgi:hypothetical protein
MLEFYDEKLCDLSEGAAKKEMLKMMDSLEALKMYFAQIMEWHGNLPVFFSKTTGCIRKLH